MKPRRFLLALAILSLASWVFAGDGTPVEGKQREQIQSAMTKFLEGATIDGTYYLYDPVESRLLALKLEGLHEGVKQDSGFFVSCADFRDQFGRKLDVDVAVILQGDRYVATAAILHKIEGTKRPYSLRLEKPKPE